MEQLYRVCRLSPAKEMGGADPGDDERAGITKAEDLTGFRGKGLAEGDEEFREALKAPGLAVGDEIFRQWVEKQQARAIKGRPVKQDVSFRRVMEPLPAARVVEEETRGVA